MTLLYVRMPHGGLVLLAVAAVFASYAVFVRRNRSSYEAIS